MPTLDWIGKKAVLNHHRQVPYRLLHANNALSLADSDSGKLQWAPAGRKRPEMAMTASFGRTNGRQGGRIGTRAVRGTP